MNVICAAGEKRKNFARYVLLAHGTERNIRMKININKSIKSNENIRMKRSTVIFQETPRIRER